ncbi:MAG: MOSC domain-containing protein [Verrucomicrobiota bacterium]|jgi:MOSC domain-containing protein YiiM
MTTLGTVASLHLHPARSGEALEPVAEIQVQAGQGIAGNPRYFDRKRRDGTPSRRQISLIAREQIADHEAALGLAAGAIPPGAIRANIETCGVNLTQLVGRKIEVGEAILFFYETRKPCHKMDAVAPGLQRLMSDGRQGVMAEVVRSGRIRLGDPIREV